MTTQSFSDVELALTSTALAGDAGGLYRIAGRLMDGGVSFDSLLFDYLLPTERAIGRRWEQGDYLIAEEHAATAAIETVISLLAGMFDRPEDATSVVVTTAEGDDHSLPARASAAHLLFLGYRTTFLGSSVPGQDLEEFLASERPAVVVVSCAMSSHLPGARAVIGAAHAEGIPVVAGGKGFGRDGEWAEALGADRWVAAHSDVPEAIDSLANGHTIEGKQPDPAEFQDLVAKRSVILASAEASLAQGNGTVDRRLREEVRVLVGAVEASVLVNDSRVVADMLGWQQRALHAFGYEAFGVAAAVKDALEVHASAEVAALIDLSSGSGSGSE